MRPNEVARIAHDPDVFEVFYREHVDAVQRFVARRIADPHLTADLTAEVFLAAIDAAASYRPRRGAPALWLFGVARNVINSEFRRAAHEKQVNARFQGRRLLADDDIVRAQERIDAEARSRELYAALDGLTDAERYGVRTQCARRTQRDGGGQGAWNPPCHRTGPSPSRAPHPADGTCTARGSTLDEVNGGITMNAPQRFEDRLLAQLRRVVAEREDSREPTHNRTGRRRLVLSGAGAALVIAIVAIAAVAIGTGSRTTGAYAIQVRPGGKVAVSIYRLGDAKALQRSLRAAGVPAVVDFEVYEGGPVRRRRSK